LTGSRSESRDFIVRISTRPAAMATTAGYFLVFS
jgi:hypothetical protein